jgi:hypothetical protein
MVDAKFSFEDLTVWQDAVVFADNCLDVIDRIETDRQKTLSAY